MAGQTSVYATTTITLVPSGSWFSDEGWAECKVKPPCSQEDYFQIHTPCDSEGKVTHTHTNGLAQTHTHTNKQGT